MSNRDIGKFLISAAAIFMMLMVVGSGPAQDMLQISGAEVNQALGVQKDSHKYFVAGKNTVVRAFLNKAVTISENSTGVSVYRNGQHVFDMSPKMTNDPVTSVDFLCTSLASCGNWAEGDYTFGISVNGVDYNLNTPVTFRTGTPLRVLVVPINSNYGNDGVKAVTGNAWKQLGEFTQNVYPLAEGNLKWTNRLQYLDCSSNEFNMSTNEGQNNINAALHDLIPAKCKTSPNDPGCYDYVIGMIPETVPVQGTDSVLEGWAPMDLPVVVVVAGSNDAAGTVAHEIAHKFGIGDTYDDAAGSSIRCSVNPAPDGFKGREWDNGFLPFAGCKSGRPASTLIGARGSVINGAMVPASSNPYEWNRGYLGEKADFMSGGGALQTQLWITQDTYDWLFRKLVLKDPTAKGKRSVIGESETENRFISFSGFITKDNAVELDPWETYWDYAALEDSTGEYMVQAVDASGTVLASSEFDVQFFQVSTGRDLDSVYFDGLANFPESTAKFRIVKGGEVLAEIPVSSSDPVVSGVTPLSSTIMDGIQTITWSAVDAEGAPLTYSVSFNHDAADPESPWVILADGLDTQSFEQDFSLLEGDTGTHAKIRVTASDGLRSGYSESAYFTVHPKAPEVFINDLPENSELNDETGIAFSASVFDVHDQSFDQANIRWTSSLSGSLGTGSEILVKELAVGIHTITVTATNSAGLSGSDTVEVEVTEDAGSSQNSSGGMCFIETAYSGTQTDAWIMLPAVLTAFLILKKKTGFLLAKLLERINILE